MSTTTSRLLWQNWCQLANSTVTASSQETGYPDDWLKDPLRSKTWRSKLGWTVVAGFNDKFDFLEGTSFYRASTLAAGTYASGTSMATQLQTKMNAIATSKTAASTGVPFTVTYSSTAYKFTVTRASTKVPKFGLRLKNGTNTNYSVGPCLGFATTSDLLSVASGTNSYTAQTRSYQSRQTLTFDLAAARDMQVAILHYHNIVSSGSVRLLADAANSATGWTTPALSTGLTLGDVAIQWLSTKSYRYWRFLINNTKQDDGYTYVGIPYIGEYTQPSLGLSNRFSEGWFELSEIGYSDQGATYQLERDRGRKYSLTWVGLDTNERNKIKNMAAFTKVGRPFFFALAPTSDVDDPVYVVNTQGIDIDYVPPNHWQVTMQVAESLG